jgi:hypothetical protein
VITVSPVTSKLFYGTGSSAVADGVVALPVKVRLRDSNLRPAAGVAVELVADRAGVTIEQPGLTDATGLAIGFVRATTPGPVNISCLVLQTEE